MPHLKQIIFFCSKENSLNQSKHTEVQWNVCNLTTEFSDFLWHPTKIYGPKVFLLIEIKPQYSNIRYNLKYFPGPLVCRIRQVLTSCTIWNISLDPWCVGLDRFKCTLIWYDQMKSSLQITGVDLRFLTDRVAQSLVVCVVFCRSLFVFLYFFFWPLYCLSFFNVWLLITPFSIFIITIGYLAIAEILLKVASNTIF